MSTNKKILMIVLCASIVITSFIAGYSLNTVKQTREISSVENYTKTYIDKILNGNPEDAFKNNANTYSSNVPIADFTSYTMDLTKLGNDATVDQLSVAKGNLYYTASAVVSKGDATKNVTFYISKDAKTGELKVANLSIK